MERGSIISHATFAALNPRAIEQSALQPFTHQPAWRRFHLPNRNRLPNARQLHEFRQRLTPMLLRQINERLLLGLLEGWPKDQLGVGLMDATDLPAATNEYKKKLWWLLCA